MAKHLVVVESPAKSKTLTRFLGKEYDIMSTVGHIVDLPKSKLGVDVKNEFRPDYAVIEGKQKVLSELKKAAKKADKVYLAPDPDREGEAIAWHVANSLKGSKADCVRVTFNEITRSAVLQAMDSPRQIDQNLVDAQQARRVLDRLVGYIVSPFLWKTVARNLSAGRVQSVALRLVCEREAEIAGFTSEEYWQIKALMATEADERFEADLYRIDKSTVSTPNDRGKTKVVIESQDEAERIVGELREQEFSVADVKKSTRTRRPAAPFITSTLQQEAAKVYGFSPKQTMSIAQRLYEGIDIGKEGPTGLITYMRTDSTRLSGEATKWVRDHIADTYGKEYLPPRPNVYSRSKGAQDAHEAIRPTQRELPPEKVKKHLTPQQFKLYTLVWNRFVACQMKNATFDTLTVDIAGGTYTLRATAQKLQFDGFLRVYHEAKEPDENGNGNGADRSLPELKSGQPLNVKEVTPSQSFTKPPARYSEAMLVKRMEADGIGRPSTYATIISTLRDRKYVELIEKKLRPTELGTTVNKILVENFPDIFDVGFTASMEKELDQVEEGNDNWVKVVNDFYKPFMATIEDLKGREKEIKASMTEKTDITCDKCGSPMVIKWGRNGRFLACSAYPDCKNTRPLPEEEAASRTDEKCEKCGSPMVIKTGRYGRFLACSAYPDCKNTKPVTLGIDCPRESCDGKLVEKQSRGRRVFYGCSKYPKCDYATWDRPVDVACPMCKHPFMVHKESKAKGEYHRCPQCKHEQPVEKTEAVKES